MIFKESPLEGAYIIELKQHHDPRGSFTRLFCRHEFERHGLDFKVVQTNHSYSHKKHTLRGMHYQTGAGSEKKLVKCIHGSILDVIVDLREHAPTFGHHYKIELTESNNLMMLVPEGFAHGFLTLEDHSQVLYHVSNFYDPQLEKAIRWDDPYFGINWPVTNPILSDRDANHPDYK